MVIPSRKQPESSRHALSVEERARAPRAARRHRRPEREAAAPKSSGTKYGERTATVQPQGPVRPVRLLAVDVVNDGHGDADAEAVRISASNQ